MTGQKVTPIDVPQLHTQKTIRTHSFITPDMNVQITATNKIDVK